MSCQLSVGASINVIIQVPLLAPVMKRELANKMYTPTAYYLGLYTSNLVLELLYPMMLILILFWNISIAETRHNFLSLAMFGILTNMVFSAQGYFLGIMILDDNSAKIVNLMFIMFFITASGIFVNLRTANWVVKAISNISPTRFNSEGLFRAVSQQIPDYTHLEPVPIPIS